MNEQEKIEAYLSSVRHDLRSQLMVVREGASMIMDGVGNENCDNCFTLLKPALESTDELNKLIGELLSTSKFNTMLVPLLSAKEEEMKHVKKELLTKEEELKRVAEEMKGVKKQLLVKEEEVKSAAEEMKSAKKGLLAKEEELKSVREEMRSIKKELQGRDEELKNVSKTPLPLEGDMEILKYEMMGMISHVIRTPLAVVKESLSLVLDEIPGKLNVKQKELLSTGKLNVDNLIQSVEEIFQKAWDEIVNSSRSHFTAEVLTKKEMGQPKKRILIVEDQAVIVDMLRMRLEANNYEVLTASDGQAGLDKAQKEKPSLIILDVMLPKMNGYKVCQLLKTDPKYSAIPIIISSGRTPQEIKKVGQEVGADAYVSKPFEAEELLAKMKELLEKKGK
jgi:CheY-like chemotaxis protein